MRDVSATRRSRVWRRAILLGLAIAWAATAIWQTNKPLPPGVHVESAWYPINPRDVALIADVTGADAYGRPVVSQAIFEDVLGLVRSARRWIVLDYFLFNAQQGTRDGSLPPLRRLSDELREALIEQRRVRPDLQVLFITDPINDVYGGAPSRDLRLLRSAGVNVVVTDLDRLRDSNYLYSSFWRLCIGWWSARPGADPDVLDESRSPGWLPNPLDESADPITFRSWARLLNFKANHRKVALADDGAGGLTAIVGSANPHDASSANSNVALKLAGPGALPLLASELEIARFSGWRGHLDTAFPTAVAPPVAPAARSDGPRAKVLTEGAIRSELLGQIDGAARGEAIDLAMFYLADRGIVQSLVAASRRGVGIRIILDPNKDAFGHAKAGIPNQPVASDLVASSDGAIHVRWYRTHGEQFHTKLAMVYGKERLWLTVGSANLTRRNLADYNLEANLAVDVPRGSQLALQALGYFDTLWSNRAAIGIEYTADFGYYADPSQLRYWAYRVMEGTGLSTF